MKPKFKRIEIPGYRERSMPKGFMYFLYAPEGNFLLIGQNHDSLRDYIDKNFPICIYRWICYNKGKSRGMWSGQHPTLRIYVADRREEKSNTAEYSYRRMTNKIVVEFCHYNNGETTRVTFTCRRMPNKWIPEWDDAIKMVLQ